MARTSLKQQADSIARMMHAAGEENIRPLFKALLLLGRGRPVSQQTLAQQFDISATEAKRLLEKFRSMGGEFDAGGNFVGMGLTLSPTPHQYIVNDQLLYVWCIEDAITFPAILKQTALIISTDPVNQQKVQFTVTPKGVDSIKPPTAVVSRRCQGADPQNIRASFCDYGNVFTSLNSAKKYANLHQGIELEIMRPKELFQIGQLVIEKASFLKNITASTEQSS